MTVESSGKPVSIGNALKAGLISGVIAAIFNNVWNFIAQAFGSDPPDGFFIAVTISSILPLVIGGLLYFLCVRFLPKGELVFILFSIAFTLISLFPTFNTTQLPDGRPVGEGFTLLTLPMHFISGALAVWGIPRFSK